jgi:uncharacterized cupredoxin-like copper-binding protein
MTTRRPRGSLIGGAAIAVVALAALSTVAVAAFSGQLDGRSRGRAPNGQCSAPSLPGTVIDVQLMNMGGPMMRGAPMMGGTMRVAVDRTQVPAGTVSFRVVNVGNLVHELVVLPLSGGASAGQRSIDADGRVDEAGSLGEASTSCGSGAGDGIEPGSVSWTTLQLTAGYYELVCNLPGHYGAGMHATLHVVSG